MKTEVYVDGCSNLMMLGPITKLKLFSLSEHNASETQSDEVLTLTIPTTSLLGLTKHLNKVFANELQKETDNED